MIPRILAAGAVLLFISGCRTPSLPVAYQVQELGVVTGTQPLVVQPDLAKWRALKLDMTEEEVVALLGKPFRKQERPPDDTDPSVMHVYGWDFGELAFNSFTTKAAFAFTVVFHQGRVCEIRDPWDGEFSRDGRPTVPELVLPAASQRLDHYPRFIDFRWQPSSGVYPVEYEVAIQSLSVNEADAENMEDYIRRVVDESQESMREQELSPKEMEKAKASFAQHLRQEQGVLDTYRFKTHDLYLPFTWVGANTGRWRVRASNQLGASEWSAWRYFKFSR